MKKKIATMLLAVAMVITVFASCGKDQGSSSPQKASGEEQVTLRVGMGTSVPYGYLDENEKPAGFVVDLWEEIGRRTGYEMDIQYINGTDAQFASLDADKIDILGGQQTIRDSIKDKYNFTVPYGYNEIFLVSLKGKPYKSIEDLHGLNVCIDAGGKLAEFFNNYNENLPEGEEKINLVFTEGSLLENLKLDRFQAFPWNIVAFEKQQREGKAEEYQMFGEPIIVERNVFPVNKNVAPEVLENINKTIQEMLDDGSLKALSEKWFVRDITTPFSAATEKVAK